MSDDVRAELRITGRVQGVWYRASTAREGQRLELRGWVRNRDDGSVAAVAEGPREAVEALMEWCRRGPPLARVDDVAVEWSDATGSEPAFRPRY